MRRLGLTFLLGAWLWATPIQPSHAEWFMDFYLGKSFPLNSDLTINQPANNSRFTIEDVSFDDESFSDPPYYGLRAGYFFERYPSLGIALEAFHFKMFAETSKSKRFTGTQGGAAINVLQPVNAVVQAFEISHGVNYVTVDAIFRNPMFVDQERFPRGRVQAYVGVGPGVVIIHSHNRVEGVSHEQDYSVGGFGVQTFAGAKVLLFKHFGVFAEYKFTHSRLKVDLSTGDATVNENTHHVVFGVTVPFR